MLERAGIAHRAQDVDWLALDDCDIHIACSAHGAPEGCGQFGLQVWYGPAGYRELPELRNVHAAALIDRIFRGQIHAREDRGDDFVGSAAAAVERDAQALEEGYLQPVAVGDHGALCPFGNDQ
ncbi:MAG: hypothetical protein WB509_15125 [Acetobacteraceae bacterium]